MKKRGARIEDALDGIRVLNVSVESTTARLARTATIQERG
jgi:hypothetical protein